MKPIATPLFARLGNAMFQYAYAKKLAEGFGAELHTNPWIGQKIFQIDDKPIIGNEELLHEEYHQDQASIIYTRADCRRWFKFRPELEERLKQYVPHYQFLAHYRNGDYPSAGYPVISKEAYFKEFMTHCADRDLLYFCEEETPLLVHHFPDFTFLPDFWRMMHCDTLFRGNSSFSWWAATLGTCRVFSPVVIGLKAGVENDNVPFVEGNWPRLCELEFVQDLHLKES